ncbi:hypothetical protein V8E54_008628 [Elaphomyces granulatus]
MERGIPSTLRHRPNRFCDCSLSRTSYPHWPPTTYASTALASAQKSGLASNAFGIRDAHGITPLSLPPEGEWESLEMLMSAAQTHARLAGYAVVQGPGGEKRAGNKGRWTKYLICKHTGSYDVRGLKDEDRKRPNRQTRKTKEAFDQLALLQDLHNLHRRYLAHQWWVFVRKSAGEAAQPPHREGCLEIADGIERLCPSITADLEKDLEIRRRLLGLANL